MSTAELLAVGGQAFPSGLTGVVDKVSIQASQKAPSNTAAASAALVIDGAPLQPTLTLSMAQTAPLLSAGGACLTCFSTTQATQANAVMLAKPQVPCAAVSYPANSRGGWGGHAPYQGRGARDVIQCPTITANSAVKVWLLGTPAITAGDPTPEYLPAAVTIDAGVGFEIQAQAGTLWGWEVLFG